MGCCTPQPRSIPNMKPIDDPIQIEVIQPTQKTQTDIAQRAQRRPQALFEHRDIQKCFKKNQKNMPKVKSNSTLKKNQFMALKGLQYLNNLNDGPENSKSQNKNKYK